MNISEITKKYYSKISPLDMEILISFAIKKSREFVLANPKYKLTRKQGLRIKNYVKRRINHEPIAYIVKNKEFYGLDFKANKHTLIPRPETELIVDKVLHLLRNKLRNKVIIIDIGTGSGNIVTSIAHNSKQKENIEFFATDISKKALNVAKKNAKKYNLDKKISFLHGSLLDPLIGNCNLKIGNPRMIILANLPYLSEEIYSSSPDDVKKYEPKTALFSDNAGLAHYEELLKKLETLISTYHILHTTCYLEISPEQKSTIEKIIKKYFPESKIKFHKDLAGKWRICQISF